MRFVGVAVVLAIAVGLCGCTNSGQSGEKASGSNSSGEQLYLVGEEQKVLLDSPGPSVLLGGAEVNYRCLASYDLDTTSILGAHGGSLVSLSVEEGAGCGVFSASAQDEVLESGLFPNYCEAGDFLLRVGCLLDLDESSYSKLLNGDGPERRKLTERAISKMDGLVVTATMDSGDKYQWKLTQV